MDPKAARRRAAEPALKSSGTAHWWSLPSDEVVQRLLPDAEAGLSSDAVATRRERYGRNQLAKEPPLPAWKKFLAQFQDLVIWILIAAAMISGLVGDWIDTAAIMAIVILNAAIGFFQEERASRALTALQTLSSPVVKVTRDGMLAMVPVRELVPGDRIELEAGDHIPADARLLRTFGFRTQEAALTGESVPVDKQADDVLSNQAPVGDRRNMVFMGTVASVGKASAVVVATGMATELGRIAGLLQRFKPEPTPLQRRLAELGRVLIVACLVIVAIIFALQMLRGGEFVEVLLVSVSLAVAAVPEGMPAVVTVTLAIGLSRMVKRNALVRKLPSVETLGCVTVICSDKTGTLTRNEMTVREVMVSGQHYRITGVGYAPDGTFQRQHRSKSDDADRVGGATPAVMPENATEEAIDPTTQDDLMLAMTIAARCNHAALIPPSNGNSDWQVIGDPTEGALLVAARKAGIDDDDNKVIDEIPFDSQRKLMSVLVQGRGSKPVIYAKGAPEAILDRCISRHQWDQIQPLTELHRKQILQDSANLAARALRVLAIAYKECPVEGNCGIEQAPTQSVEYEHDLVFVGLVGMIDPPRSEVLEAVKKCQAAGIRAVMITGDHPATALAIARELQIARPHGSAITGTDLDAMSDEELAKQIVNTSVIARVAAEHKMRIVLALQKIGQVVAMTGDGVNDAPAVKNADIGIAMGVTGTDVTKEASDMVLIDDNFASIVNAVEEGRSIFDNIQKFVHYLLSCNAGEVSLMFFAALMNWPIPLTAIQILWINLVTDGLPALALGMEPPERGIMNRPPRSPQEGVITWRNGVSILSYGVLIAAVAIAGFWVTYGGDETHLQRARTTTFCIATFSQIFFSLGCRSQRFTMPELGLFTNLPLFAAMAISGLLQLSICLVPVTRPVFDVTLPNFAEWILILVLSLIPVTVIEIGKLVKSIC